jgi:''chromo'' (CHRromatin Organisation MOdifier) domain.
MEGYTAEGDTWEREENLENAKEMIEEFEEEYEGRRLRKERRKERREVRGSLPGRYTAKMLYGWDDGKFKEEYLKKLEESWRKWKGG